MSESKERAIPSHVGVIMDGNGRWAENRGLPRIEGHREGLKTAKRIVAEAHRSGVQILSLYVFSTENWKRSKSEVSFLMSLIHHHLSAEFDFYREHGARILHSGDRNGLPAPVLEDIDAVIRDTADHKGIIVNMAINYGGRDEIVRAVNGAIAAGGDINEQTLALHMDNPQIPDPDLIIRTGGEERLSNFLLWQSAYSEFWFSDRLWPDFSEEDFQHALADFGKRERRFGGIR